MGGNWGALGGIWVKKASFLPTHVQTTIFSEATCVFRPDLVLCPWYHAKCSTTE